MARKVALVALILGVGIADTAALVAVPRSAQEALFELAPDDVPVQSGAPRPSGTVAPETPVGRERRGARRVDPPATATPSLEPKVRPQRISPRPSAALRVAQPTGTAAVHHTTTSRVLVRGQATYYCLPGSSPCAVRWPASGPYAAAGSALRAALGRHWRGRWVTVHARGHVVRVRLIDWCGCRGIDLYGSQFRRLAPLGAGRISVVITP